MRLKFASGVTTRITLNFRLRLPLDSPLVSDPPTEIPIRWLRVRDALAGPMRVQVASEPGISLEVLGRGWSPEPGDEPGESDAPVQFTMVTADADPAPLQVRATAQNLAPLPALVVSRLGILTVQGPSGTLNTRAWYRVETHEGSLPVALPPGARWVQAKVGGEIIREIETPTKGEGYRLRFPPRWEGSAVVVELEYTVPARLSAPPWQPPRLLDDGLVQETLWEAPPSLEPGGGWRSLGLDPTRIHGTGTITSGNDGPGRAPRNWRSGRVRLRPVRRVRKNQRARTGTPLTPICSAGRVRRRS